MTDENHPYHRYPEGSYRTDQYRALATAMRREAIRTCSRLIWSAGLVAVARLLLGASLALRAVQEWHRVRRASAELGLLSDDMLKDIGVSRSEIPWLAQHGRSDHPSRTIAVARLQQRLPRRLSPVLPGGVALPPDKHAA